MRKNIIILMLVFLLSCTTVFAVTYPSNNLISYWKWDNGINDSMGVNNLSFFSQSMPIAHNSSCLTSASYCLILNGSHTALPYLLKESAFYSTATNLTVVIWKKTNIVSPTDYIGMFAMGSSTSAQQVILGSSPTSSTAFADMPAGYDFNWKSPANFSNSSWELHTYIINLGSGTVSLYVNDSFKQAVSKGSALGIGAGRIVIGGKQMTNGGWVAGDTYNGVIGDVWLYNRTLNSSEIALIYSSSLATPNPILVNSANLTNIFNKNVLSSIQVTYDSVFDLRINVTTDGILKNSTFCNFSAYNISFEFSNNASDIANFTISKLSQFDFSATARNLSVLNDRVTFRICANQPTIRIVGLFFNNLNYKNLSAEIPQCSIGLHQESFVNNLTFPQNINFSLRCLSCTLPDSFNLIRSLYGNVSANLDYDRVFSFFNDGLIANNSDGFYWSNYSGYHLGFDVNGLVGVNVSCNSSNQNNISQTFNFIAGSFPPSISFLSVGNSSPFVNNSIMDNQDIPVLIDVVGGFVVNSNITLKDAGGSVLYFIQGESGIIPYQIFGSNGNYTLEARGQNFNSTVVAYASIQIVDTTNPVITWIQPGFNNLSEALINQPYNLQVVFSDNNLWAYNLTCVHSVIGEVLSNFTLNISSSVYYFNSLTLNLSQLGIVVCSGMACDSHTLEIVPKSNPVFDDADKEIIVDNKVLFTDVSNTMIDNVEFIQDKDRLRWKITYLTYELQSYRSEIGKIINPEVELPFYDDSEITPISFKVSKDLGWIPVYDGIPGHLASWNTKQWLDFVSPNVGIKEVEDHQSYYLINADLRGSQAEFSSLGGLNCRSDTVQFSVVKTLSGGSTGSVSTGFSNIGSGFAIYLCLICFVWVLMFSLGFITKMPIFHIIGLIFGLWFGLHVLALDKSFGVIFLVSASVLFLGALFGEN